MCVACLVVHGKPDDSYLKLTINKRSDRRVVSAVAVLV